MRNNIERNLLFDIYGIDTLCCMYGTPIAKGNNYIGKDYMRRESISPTPLFAASCQVHSSQMPLVRKPVNQNSQSSQNRG